MAILIHSTVESDSSEGWFRSAVRVQKVEQLNAALSLLLWLLHIQQVTHFHPPPTPLQTPLPHTNWCFLVEGKETFFPPLAGWVACVVRRPSWRNTRQKQQRCSSYVQPESELGAPESPNPKASSTFPATPPPDVFWNGSKVRSQSRT